MRTLGRVAPYWSGRKGDATAIWFQGRRQTWTELDHVTNCVAGALRAAGHRPGDRVGILSANRMEWCETAIGIIRAGCTLVPLNTKLATPELSYIVEHSGMAALLASAELVAKAKASRPAHAAPVDVISFDDQRYRALTQGPVFDDNDGGVTDASPAIVQYTSGTTGRPKGVVLTHAGQLAVAELRMHDHPAFDDTVRSLLVAPLYFTGGVITGLLATYTVGGSFYLEPEFDPVAALDVLTSERIVSFLAVPTILRDLAQQPDFADADLSALQIGITGGAACPDSVLKAWQAKGVDFRQGWSLTEAGGVTTMATAAQARRDPTRCGAPLIHTDVRVIDERDCECSNGQPGELLVRGPAVMAGYLDDEAATRDAFTADGWLRTGDIGVRHEDGTFSLVDRKKDMIISGGINVYPAEIEAVIAEMPSVVEVAVIGIPHDRWDEVPMAIVRATDVTEQAIVDHCRERLATYKVPTVTLTDAELPRTASGKIMKAPLRARFGRAPDASMPMHRAAPSATTK